MSGAISIGAIPSHAALDFPEASRDQWWFRDDADPTGTLGVGDKLDDTTKHVPDADKTGNGWIPWIGSTDGYSFSSGDIHLNLNTNPLSNIWIDLSGIGPNWEAFVGITIGGNNPSLLVRGDIFSGSSGGVADGFYLPPSITGNELMINSMIDTGFATLATVAQTYTAGDKLDLHVKVENNAITYRDLTNGVEVSQITGRNSSAESFGLGENLGGGINYIHYVNIKQVHDPYHNFIVYDDFTGTDGDPLDSSTGAHAPQKGSEWIARLGGGTVQSNAADLGTATPDLVTMDVGSTEDIEFSIDLDINAANRIGVINRYVSTADYTFFEVSGDAGGEIKYRHHDGSYNNVDCDSYAYGTGSRTIRMRNQGLLTSIFIDDVLTFAVMDSGGENGTHVGLWGWNADDAVFDNFMVSTYSDSNDAFMVYDAFTDTDGTPLDTSTDGHFPDKGPRWTTAYDGTWDSTGGLASMTVGGGGANVLPIQVGTSDLTVECDVTFGTTDNYSGVAVNITDSNNMTEVMGRGADSAIYFVDNTGGVRNIVATLAQTITNGVTLTLRVESTGTAMEVFIDDVSIGTYTDTNADHTGNDVGLWAWADTPAIKFNNFKAYASTGSNSG